MALSLCCSAKSFVVLLLLSAVPISYVLHSETSERATHVFAYHSGGWLRECAKWDDLNRRFLVSFFEGGLGVVPVQEHPSDDAPQEILVVGGAGLGRNSSLGLAIDRPRNRVVVAVADVIGNKYSAVAAYDLTTWDRLFLTQLSGPDEKAFADDVAVDPHGNAYITDTKGNKIWKVGPNGEFIHSIKSPLFAPKEWYLNLVGLNGIVYHPNGYLLVIHTITGNLFKIELDEGNNHQVKAVKLVEDSLRFGDGLEVLSPTRLVVAGNPSRLVESLDDFETGKVVGKFGGVTHRLVTAATVKDGKVYLNHLFGLGYPKRKHVLVEADFS
ncbi:calcium-dependent phosphotriesterase superfamily protein [Striga asiatica]|uniref:Calcium-dependent phosphotriesterase superfamily protein n=1 Tax=Striga asiatica TaxID=4170 RepID=A0A5A7QIP4_STRAF|nr:calcium-dependent phosphotriesterase superfamily protein [Striga asiatica]